VEVDEAKRLKELERERLAESAAHAGDSAARGVLEQVLPECRDGGLVVSENICPK